MVSSFNKVIKSKNWFQIYSIFFRKSADDIKLNLALKGCSPFDLRNTYATRRLGFMSEAGRDKGRTFNTSISDWY